MEDIALNNARLPQAKIREVQFSQVANLNRKCNGIEVSTNACGNKMEVVTHVFTAYAPINCCPPPTTHTPWAD